MARNASLVASRIARMRRRSARTRSARCLASNARARTWVTRALTSSPATRLVPTPTTQRANGSDAGVVTSTAAYSTAISTRCRPTARRVKK